ncbi:AMP-binding protein [Methylophilus aquaticus]|uniref:AMP-binding protein n=1 Tax=Methylophilus aquaticus TaxID=1971610 RepID=A0ABT9JQQ8_9PROT|nr:AMP-binding protein [Methylophilus aquaticus]MDP8566455.1 AMP-binding protein [Methylophilus aquaticus]
MLDRIYEYAIRTPEVIALEGASTTISYQALPIEVQHVADWLAAHMPRSSIALAMDNSPAWVLVDLAAMTLSLPAIPIPAFFSASQKQHALQDAGVGMVVTDDLQSWELLYPHAEVISQREVAGKVLTLLRVSSSIGEHAAAKITYTSGTTGQPKGVCLPAQAMWQVASAVHQATQSPQHDRHFCILPLATLLENVAGVYASLLSGATVVIYSCHQVGFTGSQFDIQRLYAGLRETRSTTAILIPELLRALVMLLQTGQHVIDSLRFLAVGGARVSPALLEEAHALGLPVYEGYGLSECASVVTLNTPGAGKTGSIGKALPHVQLKLDAAGELWVKGAVYDGYTHGQQGVLPASTDADGYIATGDLAFQDTDGFWYVSGRKKNVLITSFGRNVSPEWVESELMFSPHIMQACVFGEARPFNVAVLVPRATSTAVEIAQAVAQINAGLPDYAQVADWVIAETSFSPHNSQLTANGRLKRDQIWQYYQPAIEAVYQEIL